MLRSGIKGVQRIKAAGLVPGDIVEVSGKLAASLSASLKKLTLLLLASYWLSPEHGG